MRKVHVYLLKATEESLNESLEIYHTGAATLIRKTHLPQLSWGKSGKGIACQNGALSG